MHRPIDPPTPWLRLIGLGTLGLGIYLLAAELQTHLITRILDTL